MLGKWLSTLQYVFKAPQIIDYAYAKVSTRPPSLPGSPDSQRKQARGAPFAIPSVSEYQIFVSSERHIREVDESSEAFLSLHAAMEDVSLHLSRVNLS